MTVVVVFLLADTQGGVDNVVVLDKLYFVEVRAGGGGEAEVLGYDRKGRCAQSPLWVSNLFEYCWVVIAPFRFLKSCVGSQNDPVGDGMDKRVLGSALH